MKAYFNIDESNKISEELNEIVHELDRISEGLSKLIGKDNVDRAKDAVIQLKRNKWTYERVVGAERIMNVLMSSIKEKADKDEATLEDVFGLIAVMGLDLSVAVKIWDKVEVPRND